MFESFKDFIESTGDGELMELYSEFLETGDDTRMMLRLKKLGYDMSDNYMMRRIVTGKHYVPG